MVRSHSASLLFDLDARGNWVRLRTLILLRWIAVAGQAVTVLVAAFGLGFDIPLAGCALLISASAALNVVMQLAWPPHTRLSEAGTFLSLLFDLLQLTALLLLTGGLNNPFALLLVAPVTISATALRLHSTIWLAVAAIAATALMIDVHLPLIDREGTVLEVPALYRSGMAVALVVTIVFLAFYARRVAVEEYAMSRALLAARMALARERQLSAIGSIAAATAHELGTPLATIKLVAGELARELADRPELAEDAELIRREAERCGAVLRDLARGRGPDRQTRAAPIGAIIEEAAAPHLDRGKALIVRIDGAPVDSEHAAQPVLERRPELVHGLRNLIQNAFDFARSTVWVDVEHDDEGLRIRIGDDGPGFSPEILPYLGEPYVSTRSGQPLPPVAEDPGEPAPAGAATEVAPPDTAGEREEADLYEGLGLGVFIARTLLERIGARLTFANAADGRERRARHAAPAVDPRLGRPTGAIVEILLPGRLILDTTAARRPEAREDAGAARG